MGTLDGLRVIELSSIGPVPFAAMMLADLGADVLRIDRPGGPLADVAPPDRNALNRGRRSVAVDLKARGGEVVLRLCESADVLIEGFRPGVMERLGLGPEVCTKRNPRLVYARMTGWGQEGPYAPTAGHDINYIALSGALAHIGLRGHPPTPPINLIGDYGGGGMLLVVGVLAALHERERSGIGQVIDAAMVDGAALLATVLYTMRAQGVWCDERGTNVLDGGAHFYGAYECADGRYVAVGSLEPQFYAQLLRRIGLEDEVLPEQMDRTAWPAMQERLAAIFKSKTREEWCQIMEGTDVCFAPVLTTDEAPEHPHNAQRGTFVKLGGVLQPAPAPRFSRTPSAITRPPAVPGEHTDETLRDWGFGESDIRQLHEVGAVF